MIPSLEQSALCLSVPNRLNLQSGYETIYEFNEYAKEHYAKIDPYHIENGSIVWNTKIM